MFRTRGGAAGRYGRRVAEALAGTPGADSLDADLARDLADALDAARRDQDRAGFLSLSDRLVKVMARLNGSEEVSFERRDDGELPAGLAEALEGCADVRDGAE